MSKHTTTKRERARRLPPRSVPELSDLVSRLDAALRSIARIVADTQKSSTERLESIRRELDELRLLR